MDNTQPPVSPRWGAMTKLVVSLTLIVVLGALLVHFKYVLVPVLMAFVLTYLLFPLASLLNRKVHLSWALAVNLIYLVFILILLALLTWGGVGLIGQVQNLIIAIQRYANALPGVIDSLSHTVTTIGPFRLDFSTVDWQAVGNQVLSYVEPALGKVGGLVGTLATGAATTVGWTAFVVIVSYFFLLESGGFRTRIIRVDVPGYTEDIERLSHRLARIWNAFLRGQIIIFFSKVIAYMLIMTVMGVHFAIGIALLAGLASFLPYIGPAINYLVLGLVAYFQGGNLLGMAPLTFAIVAIIVGIIIDQGFDNLVSPRIMASSLKVHPAFVLIAAIIAANLIGILGLIIAAPLLATLQLVGRYTIRKLLDRDPWPPEEAVLPSPRTPKWLRKARHWLRDRLGRRSGKLKEEPAGFKDNQKTK
jgi:predicted PurR-regulated permease PerM